MASRCLGELMLRPSPWARIAPPPSCPHLRPPPSWTARRGLTSTPSTPAQPQRKGEYDDSAYDDEFSPAAPSSQTPPYSSRGPASSIETSQAIDSLISNMSSNRGGGFSSSSPFGSSGQEGSSSDDIKAARSGRLFGSEFSDAPRGYTARRPPSLKFDSMALPDSSLDPSLANKPSQAAALAARQEEIFANFPRLNATYGRTVDLDANRGRDLVRGIGMLGSLVTRNKIRSDQAKQRFHERGGLKRKRLNRERWRARFKIGFSAITSRVSELTRKGW